MTPQDNTLTDLVLCIQDENDLYYANPIYQHRWTRALHKAQIFLTEEAADKVLIKRKGRKVLVMLANLTAFSKLGKEGMEKFLGALPDDNAAH